MFHLHPLPLRSLLSRARGTWKKKASENDPKKMGKVGK